MVRVTMGRDDEALVVISVPVLDIVLEMGSAEVSDEREVNVDRIS